MRVDTSQSIYHEAPSAANEFDRDELRKLRFLLRRLRFIEGKIAQTGGLRDGGGDGGGAAFAEMEVEALEFVLNDVGFLETRSKARTRR